MITALAVVEFDDENHLVYAGTSDGRVLWFNEECELWSELPRIEPLPLDPFAQQFNTANRGISALEEPGS